MKTLFVTLLFPLTTLAQEPPPLTGFEGHVDVIGSERAAPDREEQEDSETRPQADLESLQRQNNLVEDLNMDHGRLGEKQSSDK